MVIEIRERRKSTIWYQSHQTKKNHHHGDMYRCYRTNEHRAKAGYMITERTESANNRNWDRKEPHTIRERYPNHILKTRDAGEHRAGVALWNNKTYREEARKEVYYDLQSERNVKIISVVAPKRIFPHREIRARMRGERGWRWCVGRGWKVVEGKTSVEKLWCLTLRNPSRPSSSNTARVPRATTTTKDRDRSRKRKS